jgi:hypothetical protein
LGVVVRVEWKGILRRHTRWVAAEGIRRPGGIEALGLGSILAPTFRTDFSSKKGF